MSAASFMDILGGILTIALVAVILTKPNTASDITAAGTQFTGALRQAQAGQ
jgi:hypothetical protein